MIFLAGLFVQSMVMIESVTAVRHALKNKRLPHNNDILYRLYMHVCLSLHAMDQTKI